MPVVVEGGELGLLSFSPEDYDYGIRSSGAAHGVVLTKLHVVELILDLVGYTVEGRLFSLRLLEPSCGFGAFLLPALRRLLASCRVCAVPFEVLGDAVLAFDIDEVHVAHTRAAVLAVLLEEGLPRGLAEELCSVWVRHGDFLLSPVAGVFDVIVGNPPYVRIEQLSPKIQVEYRERYKTLFDRADLYVAFLERSLRLLSTQGAVSFVCADRWTVNRYGAPLRKLITTQFSLQCYVDLHHASPFESEVVAYPSIFVIGPKHSKAIPVLSLRKADPETCAKVLQVVRAQSSEGSQDVSVAWYEKWFDGDEPWTLGSPEHRALLKDLEARFLPMEAHARVGIGVATGNDAVLIVPENADVEPDRLVHLVMRGDIEGGLIRDGHRCVINVFGADGGVVELAAYPRLERYLLSHEAELRKRHVAKKSSRAWFRTIDRVYPDLVAKPKLLIPDIAGANEVAFDEGRYYPHHNLYCILSDVWDMEVLGGLLSSRVALFFVWSYAVKMRGGYLRFQAQYLRRIRLPSPKDISKKLATSIREAFRKRDFQALDKLALKAYGLQALPDFEFLDTRR